MREFKSRVPYNLTFRPSLLSAKEALFSGKAAMDWVVWDKPP